MKGQEGGFSIVIPTFNMASHLQGLVRSLSESGLSRDCSELVFVDDGSTDGTASALQECIHQDEYLRAKGRVVRLEKNRGRFEARLSGARESRSEKLLFIDTRVQLPAGFSDKLMKAAQTHGNIIPHVEIDENRNTFCLYWKRSHEFIFRKHYRALKNPVDLTPQNFEDFLKGTTVLFCGRTVFLEACGALGGGPVLNDDYRVLEEFVKREPLTIVPELVITWVPREDWRGFLHRLWSRGPSFVEYHFILHRGGFFWIVLAGVVCCAAWLVAALIAPAVAGWIALGILALTILSAALFSRSFIEFARLVPLHLGVVSVFGLGILWGLGVNLRRPAMRAGLLRNILGKSTDESNNEGRNRSADP